MSEFKENNYSMAFRKKLLKLHNIPSFPPNFVKILCIVGNKLDLTVYLMVYLQKARGS